MTSEVREVPELDRVGEWLEENAPEGHAHTLVHGDYKLDNVSFAPEAMSDRGEDDPTVQSPLELVAVFDWEMSALDDSLVDLDWTLSYWRDPKDPAPAMLELTVRFMEREGYPIRRELVDRLREVASDAYVVDEGVTSKYALLNRCPLEPEGTVSNKGGGLGYGLPAAIGAAVAEGQRDESRKVLGFVGDDSYLYYPHALHVAVTLGHGIDLTVVVSDNRNYRILKDNTIKLFGGSDADHEYVGMDFEPPVDIPANAESHGAEGRLVETPDGIAPALEDALASDGPTVLDVLVHD